MSFRCQNRRCSAVVEDDWAFCQMCGADNRPPSERTPVADCVHRIEQGEFCVLCGASTIDEHETIDTNAKWAEWIGWTMLIAGVAALIYSEVILRNLTSGSEGFGALGPMPRRGSIDVSKPSHQALALGKAAFYLIPAGAILVVFFGRRWRIFGKR